MAKGIIYVMTTDVKGIIKIGRTENKKSFSERMRILSQHGYAHVNTQKYFAAEVDNYIEIENLLKTIFKPIRPGDLELYLMEPDVARSLILAFSGSKTIYPENAASNITQIKQIAKTRKQGELFNMYNRGLKKGDILTFAGDPNIKVKVSGEREVEYNGVIYKLSPLALKLYTDMGKANKSGAYQGASCFKFNGTLLTKLPVSK